MKVSCSWGAEVAVCWNDDDRPKGRDVVNDVLGRLSSSVTSPDIEGEERVCVSTVLMLLGTDPLFAPCASVTYWVARLHS